MRGIVISLLSCRSGGGGPVHLPAGGAGAGGAAGAVLCGVRLGAHPPGGGGQPDLCHPLCGDGVGHPQRRHRRGGQGPVGGRRGAGLWPGRGLLPGHPAPGRRADAAPLQRGAGLDAQADLDGRLHFDPGPDQGGGHHPQPHLRRLFPAGGHRRRLLCRLLPHPAGRRPGGAAAGPPAAAGLRTRRPPLGTRPSRPGRPARRGKS